MTSAQTQRPLPGRFALLGILLMLALVAAACAGQAVETPAAPTATAPPTATPAAQPPEAMLNSAECPFDPPAGYAVTCGTLLVPADHANPTAGTIALFIAIAHKPGAAVSGRLADPLLYLDGGPGGYTIVNAPFILEALGQLAGDRDLILFDQRGVGLSEPELDCPETDAALRAYLTRTAAPAEMDAAWLAAYATCRDRLLTDGIDPTLFTVAQSAHDVAALRSALGYQQVNLLGISYGTLLAQAVLALPAADQWVRSVVLDSALAPDFASVTGNMVGLEQALDRVSANCATDPQCLARYGDVSALFAQTMAQLNRDPLTVNVLDPVAQQPLKIVVDGYRFRDIIFNMLYWRQGLAYVPQAIERAGRGFGDGLQASLETSLVIGAYSSDGMTATTACSFRVPETPAAVAAHNRAHDPAFAVDAASQGWFADVCATFGVEPDANAGQLVTSSVPVLVLAGEYDPTTPPAGARRVAETLGNATYLEFAGAAHGVLDAGGNVSACAVPVAAAFIADPAAARDLSCVAQVKPLGFIIR